MVGPALRAQDTDAVDRLVLRVRAVAEEVSLGVRLVSESLVRTFEAINFSVHTGTSATVQNCTCGLTIASVRCGCESCALGTQTIDACDRLL